MVHDDEPVGLDGVRVEFDDERAVSDAGVMLVATLAGRLGIEALAGRLVRLRRDRPGAANAGRKVMALLFAMVLGADSIDDCERAAGRAHAPAARRLDAGALDAGDVPARVHLRARAPARRAARRGARAGVAGRRRARRRAAGDRRGQLRRRGVRPLEAGRRLRVHRSCSGYHPILATRADTREVLHIRLRKGSANTQKGMLRFTEELIARVERAGATGVKLLRADSGFWNTKVFERLEKAGWQYSIGVRMQKGSARPSRRSTRTPGRRSRLPRRRARRRSPRPSTAGGG